MTIKPIPTEYKGVLFRSRLEARWALFFDALGIAWEYEPEAFSLPSGAGYLPDFWLPKFEGGVYAEVKPLGVGSSKAEEFVSATGSKVWICDGPPDFKTTALLCESDHRCYRLSVIPCIGNDVEFYTSPGFEEPDGRFDTRLAGDTLSRAVASVRAHRFWNPKANGGEARCGC